MPAATAVEAEAEDEPAEDADATGEPIASGTCGTCEWNVYGGGELVVRPAAGAARGELEDQGKGLPTWGDVAADITSVRFEGTVVAPESCDSMFQNYDSLSSIDLSSLDTSKVTDMSGMFNFCRSLESIDLSSFDTSSVTEMGSMFFGCESLASLDLSSFDTSEVTGMSAMFWYCPALTSLDLSSFDTSKVVNMTGMFYCCSSLKSLDLSGFDTSSVEGVGAMFRRCSSLKTLDLSGFDASSVKYTLYTDIWTGSFGTFDDCYSLTTLSLPASWPVSLEGALPWPTSDNGKWWSKAAGAWLDNDEIAARGGMADTLSATKLA